MRLTRGLALSLVLHLACAWILFRVVAPAAVTAPETMAVDLQARGGVAPRDAARVSGGAPAASAPRAQNAPRAAVRVPKAGEPLLHQTPEDTASAAAATAAATATLTTTRPPASGASIVGTDSAGESKSLLATAQAENPAPAYPRLARIRGEQGQVVISADVESPSQESQPVVLRQASVSESSGSALLDAAALGAVRRWRFPRHTNSYRLFIPFYFHLTP